MLWIIDIFKTNWSIEDAKIWWYWIFLHQEEKEAPFLSSPLIWSSISIRVIEQICLWTTYFNVNKKMSKKFENIHPSHVWIFHLEWWWCIAIIRQSMSIYDIKTVKKIKPHVRSATSIWDWILHWQPLQLPQMFSEVLTSVFLWIPQQYLPINHWQSS